MHQRIIRECIKEETEKQTLISSVESVSWELPADNYGHRDYSEKNTLGIRHVQVFMGFSAIMIAYILRVNMSVAIVAMTNKTNANPDFSEFNWNEMEKSSILSSFFWGYLMLQIIAGNFAEKFGSKILLGVAMTASAILTLFTPFVAEYGYFVVCLLRFLQGLAQGSFLPCVTVLVSKWIPPKERGRALTIAFSGSNVGILVGFQLSGFLAASKGGWPSVFYATGGLGCVWVLLWIWIGASTPAEHATITTVERDFIETSLMHVSKNEHKLDTPWRKIVTSMPLWAIFISHLGQNWGFWTLLTEMPNYVNAVLGVNIQNNGFLSSLPYLCGWGTAILFSWLSDYVNKRNLICKSIQRKLWNTLALWGGALSLFILGVMTSKDVKLIIFLLIVTVALGSGIYTGFLTNHIDLSPNFCGTLMGITNSLANITSILGPLCVGWIVTDTTSEQQWKMVFLLTSAIMFGANLFYIIFGTSELQSWNQHVVTIKNYGTGEENTVVEEMNETRKK